MRIAVIGGGAAGFFFAINVRIQHPEAEVTIYEATERLLEKVRISGGGRCNVTHACFDPRLLCGYYPRGQRELRSVFQRFQPRDTLAWFAGRGVRIQAEADGRMFPESNTSETIVQCLLHEAKKRGIRIETRMGLSGLTLQDSQWHLRFDEGQSVFADRVMLATGSQQRIWRMLQQMGIAIIEPVPSLFTFNIRSPLLEGLAGISFPSAVVEVPDVRLSERGPVLITHWGLSGPAVLKLSAVGARVFYEKKYQLGLRVQFTGQAESDMRKEIASIRQRFSARRVSTTPLWGLPRRFWDRLVEVSGLSLLNWGDVTKQQLQSLLELTGRCPLQTFGKSTYKEEFVTAGGVALTEIDFRRMESIRFPGLLMAGEILDIDGVTGGFNFQAAWSTAWIAAQGIKS